MSKLRLNITLKLILYLLIVSIVPLLITGLVALRTSTAIVSDEIERTSLVVVSNQRDFLDLQMAQIESLILNLSGVEQIRDALEAAELVNDDFTRLSTQERIGYILNSYSNLSDITSIDIFSTAGVHYNVGDTLNADTIRVDLRDQLFEESLSTDRPVFWAGVEDNINVNSTKRKVISAARVLYRINRDTLLPEPMGLIVINYDVDSLYRHLSSIDLGENGQLLVIDAKNRYVYHPNRALLGEPINPELEPIIDSSEGQMTYVINDNEMSVSKVRSDVSDWTILGVVPVETFTAKSDPIRYTIVIVLFASFLTLLIIGWFYNRDVVTPIRDITDQFKLLQQNEPGISGSYVPIKGNDEIAELSRWFNSTRILYRINHEMIAFMSLSDLFQNLVDDVIAALSAERALLVTLDVTNREIIGLYSSGECTDCFNTVTYDELDQGLTGWVIREQQIAVSPKGTVDDRESEWVRQRRQELGNGDIIVVPLYGREGVIGTLTAINRTTSRSFTHYDADLMVAIVNQARIAIENVQLVQSLRISEQKFVKAFHASPEPMSIITLEDQRYIEVNTSFINSTGYTRDEIINHTEDELGIWHDAPEHLQLLARVKTEGSVRNVEAKIKSKQGIVRTWLLSADTIELENTLCQIMVAKDITERIETERQRIELALERERIDLMAEFITKASHEFKTPLSIINTSTYLLSKSSTRPDNQERLVTINEQVDTISSLVDSMMFMTKLNAKDVDLTMEKLDLNVILRVIDHHWRTEAQRKSVECILELSEYPLYLYGNVNYMKRALNAFYSNAVKYNKSGGTVTIRSYHERLSHFVEFIDTGIGISDGDRQHIFERFYQVDKASTQRGFGLGLAIANTIIELHGGRIEVDTVEGQGSTFRILLPAPPPQETVSEQVVQDSE